MMLPGFSAGIDMKTILVNPLDETPRAAGHPAPRLDSLAGKTLGLLDISKWGGGSKSRLKEEATSTFDITIIPYLFSFFNTSKLLDFAQNSVSGHRAVGAGRLVGHSF